MRGVDVFLVLRPVLTVVSRHEHEVAQALGAPHAHLQANGVDEGLLAHGPHDARRSQNRDAACNAQTRVEGLACDFLAIWRRHLHRKAALPAVLAGNPLELGGDHRARHRVDGSGAHGLVEPGACHAAHTGPALNRGAWRVYKAHAHHDQCAVGGIRVVACVFAHAAACPGGALCIGASVHLLGFHHHGDARRGVDAQRVGEVPCKKCLPAGLGRRSRAGSCGVATAQAFLADLDIALKRHGFTASAGAAVEESSQAPATLPTLLPFL